jgi:hypothetical protein
MQEKIVIASGVALPFQPVHPAKGRTLRAVRLIEDLFQEISKPGLWCAQPLLAGERACLAVIDKKLYVQDGFGKWYKKSLQRTHDFLKLPNRTAFDGVVYEGEFHPFDLLAIDGKPLLYRSVDEREAMAFQMIRFIQHRWMFPKPTRAWLLRGAKNLPMYEGVVLKDNRYPTHYYPMGGTHKQTTLAWFTRKWS